MMAHRFGLLGAALGAVLFMTAAAPSDRPFDIYFIDVMGGAATLIVTPERESLLIDSGWPGFERSRPEADRARPEGRGRARPSRPPGRRRTGTRDHFGGVEGLSKRVRIDHFWDRGLPDPTAPDGDKAAFPDGPEADDPLGNRLPQGVRGQAAGAQGRATRSRSKGGRGRSCWPRAAR